MDIDPRRLALDLLLATLGILRSDTSLFPTSKLSLCRLQFLVPLLVDVVSSIPLFLASPARRSGSASAGSIKVRGRIP